MPPKKTTKKAAPQKAVKVTPKKAAPKKVTPKKTAPKKAAPKKTAAKKAAPKKTAPKKTAPKKTAPKKVTPKKAAPKKTAPKKTAPKKAAPKKTAAKKAAPKKTAPKKAAPKKATLAVSAPRTAGTGAAYGQWYWTGDRGSWVKFDAKQNQVMEDEYRTARGTGVARMSFNNWTYDVDFVRMEQRNCTTQRVRPIKRVLERTAGATVGKLHESASGKRQQAVQKGNGVVDALSGKVDSCHVYEGSGGEVFQCTLNQTNLAANNNKFYILQLLEEDRGGCYYVYSRWGRVGVDGQQMTEQFAALSPAITVYKQKFRDKTGNDWDSRATFTKVPGKYFLMQINYTAADDDDGTTAGGGAAAARKKARTEAAEPPPSRLPAAVQDLVALISNQRQMESTMRALDIDTTRMPLGKISAQQIKEAYACLQRIEAELQQPNPRLEELSGHFYTLIPHDFGFRRPPLIASTAMIKELMDMLDTLGQLEIASTLLSHTATGAEAQCHPLDKAYDSLHCAITPLDPSDVEFQRVVEYAKHTHGATHTAYTLRVKSVYKVSREGEDARYAEFKKTPNKQMLWHGSRTTNYMGILSQGLRIAPPEAPSTGYMFGKGIYLADVCSKSANYCNATRSSPNGLMLLCEAALGKSKKFTAAHYMTSPATGFDSTTGVGRMHPDPKGSEMVEGVLWPKGQMVQESTSTSLLYPEYIIYRVNQCRIRYLVGMEFVYR